MALKISISGGFLEPCAPVSGPAGCPFTNTPFACETVDRKQPGSSHSKRMENHLLLLIDLIYSWCRTGEGWDDILRELVDSTDSAGAAIIAHDLRLGQTKGEFRHPDPVELEKFKTYYAAINPWLPRDPSHGKPGGSIVSSEDALSLQRFKETEFYTDFGRKNDVVHSLVANFGIQSGIFRYCGVYRGPRAGPYRDSPMQLLERLSPHLNHAIFLRDKMDLVGDLTRALDRSTLPVFVLDRDGKVLHLTALAQRLCERKNLAWLSPHGRLSLKMPDGISIASEIRALVSSPAPFRVGFLHHGAPAGRGNALYVLSRSSSLSPFAAPSILLAILDAESPAEQAYAYVGRTFGLTPTEIRLVRLLVTTGSLDLAIGALEMNRNTAKKHMGSIFDKTGCRRQGQVIQMFASLSRIHPSG
jgi:DNA-binding CsgD family transcriptional regulator